MLFSKYVHVRVCSVSVSHIRTLISALVTRVNKTEYRYRCALNIVNTFYCLIREMSIRMADTLNRTFYAIEQLIATNGFQF